MHERLTTSPRATLTGLCGRVVPGKVVAICRAEIRATIPLIAPADHAITDGKVERTGHRAGLLKDETAQEADPGIRAAKRMLATSRVGDARFRSSTAGRQR